MDELYRSHIEDDAAIDAAVERRLTEPLPSSVKPSDTELAALLNDDADLITKLGSKLPSDYSVEIATRLRLAASRLSVPTWLPIETAPKNGTRVLLAKIVGHPGNYPDEPTKVIWWAVLGHWSAKFNNWNDGIEPAGLVLPTHWQPLSAPPLPKSPA